MHAKGMQDRKCCELKQLGHILSLGHDEEEPIYHKSKASLQRQNCAPILFKSILETVPYFHFVGSQIQISYLVSRNTIYRIYCILALKLKHMW